MAETAAAPRVTREQIEALIGSTVYHRVTDRLTIAVVTLANGFEVVGESACVAVENYDRETGEKFAFENAVAKIWPLEGYLLRSRLAAANDVAANARVAGLDLELGGVARIQVRDLASIVYEATVRLQERQGHDKLSGWGDAPEGVRDAMEAKVLGFINDPAPEAYNIGDKLALAITEALLPIVDLVPVR